MTRKGDEIVLQRSPSTLLLSHKQRNLCYVRDPVAPLLCDLVAPTLLRDPAVAPSTVDVATDLPDPMDGAPSPWTSIPTTTSRVLRRGRLGVDDLVHGGWDHGVTWGWARGGEGDQGRNKRILCLGLRRRVVIPPLLIVIGWASSGLDEISIVCYAPYLNGLRVEYTVL